MYYETFHVWFFYSHIEAKKSKGIQKFAFFFCLFGTVFETIKNVGKWNINADNYWKNLIFEQQNQMLLIFKLL